MAEVLAQTESFIEVQDRSTNWMVIRFGDYALVCRTLFFEPGTNAVVTYYAKMDLFEVNSPTLPHKE